MNYEEIKERAEVIFDIIEDKINYGYDLNNPDYLDCYKATLALRTRSIKQFVRSFKDSGLEFCISSVEAVHEDFSDEIPGYGGLHWSEKEVLRELLDQINQGSSRAFFN